MTQAPARPCRRAPRSASWAAASSGACWQWPPPAWGSRPTSTALESGPAFDVATRTTKAAFDDHAALAAFAQAVDAVTYEFENVRLATVRHLAQRVPVRPSARALEVAQDRLAEKEFVAALAIPVAPFQAVDRPEDLAGALARLDGPAILKTRRLGYDGKGQVGLDAGGDIAAAWSAVGPEPCVLERRVAFACELSALVVRAGTAPSRPTTVR